jgi:hypothetical protein
MWIGPPVLPARHRDWVSAYHVVVIIVFPDPTQKGHQSAILRPIFSEVRSGCITPFFSTENKSSKFKTFLYKTCAAHTNHALGPVWEMEESSGWKRIE